MAIFLYLIGFFFLLYITRNLPLVDRTKLRMSTIFYSALCITAKYLGLHLGNTEENKKK